MAWFSYIPGENAGRGFALHESQGEAVERIERFLKNAREDSDSGTAWDSAFNYEDEICCGVVVLSVTKCAPPASWGEQVKRWAKEGIHTDGCCDYVLK